MRRALLALFLLAASPLFGESIYVVDEPCGEEAPEDAYGKPLCSDYELNSALIESVKQGDKSALALLEKRYALTNTYKERHRLAAELLRRVPNDGAIWNELYADAQLAVRFASTATDPTPEFDQWCEERGFYAFEHENVLEDAFVVASADPRARGLMVKGLDSDMENLALTAVVALIEQGDVASLPGIEKALDRHMDQAWALTDLLLEMHDPRADALAKKYAAEAPEEESDDEAEDDQ